VVVVVVAAVTVVVRKGRCWGRHARAGRGSGPCPKLGSRPGRRAPQHTSFGAWVPPLEDGACHDEQLYAPILRGALVSPLKDGACHDEHL